jgi:hypothetical protein
LVADAVCNALALLGIGIGQMGGVLGAWAAPMGAVAGAAVAAIFWMTVRVEEVVGARGAELGSAAGFDPDDAVLVIPLAVWLGADVALLAAAVVAAPAFAVFYYLHFRQRIRGAAPDA